MNRYPALGAGLVNVLVVLLAKFGFHVDAAELATIASAVAAVLAAFVHSQVTPVRKPPRHAAGGVPPGGSGPPSAAR